MKVIGAALPCDSNTLATAFGQAYDPEVTTGQPVCVVAGNVKYAEQKFCGPPGLTCNPAAEFFVPNAAGGVVWAPLDTPGSAAVCPPSGGLTADAVSAFARAGVHVCGS